MCIRDSHHLVRFLVLEHGREHVRAEVDGVADDFNLDFPVQQAGAHQACLLYTSQPLKCMHSVRTHWLSGKRVRCLTVWLPEAASVYGTPNGTGYEAENEEAVDDPETVNDFPAVFGIHPFVASFR